MVHGGALAGWAVLPALRLSQYPVRHRASDHDASVPRLPEAAHVLAQDRDGDAGLAARLSNMARREARTRMETIKDKPAVRLKPSSYQPSKAAMEEDIGIDTTPEDLLRAVVCDVRIEYDENT